MRRDLNPANAWGLMQSLRSVYSPQSAAGVTVRPDQAMRCAAVFACVRVIAETAASLPLPTYRRLRGGGKERDPGHAVYTVLHDQANPEQTAMELRENYLGHLNLWGHGYAEIEYDGAGDVVALWPLRPDRTTVRRDADGQLWYTTMIERLSTTVVLPAYRVWHTAGFMGLSPIAQAREAIGLALAAEESGARFFSNDSRPGGVLKTTKRLDDKAFKRLKTSWEQTHGGLSNRHRVAILEEGVEWQAIGIPNEQAQWLETRKFQLSEIARMFRVPPHMIADLDRATYSNIEQQAIEFVVQCLRPWLVRLEQSIKRDLFTEQERQTWFAEHLVDGLLRGDAKARAEALDIQRRNGVINADDWAELENRNPLPAGQGKAYWMPANMVAVGTAPARRLAQGGRRLIVDAMERVLRREEADVMRQARKTSPAQLLSWLHGFYANHRTFMARALLPMTDALAEMGSIPVGDPVEISAGVCDNHLAQLREIVAGGGDIVEELQGRFDAWRQVRPAEMAARLLGESEVSDEQDDD